LRALTTAAQWALDVISEWSLRAPKTVFILCTNVVKNIHRPDRIPGQEKPGFWLRTYSSIVAAWQHHHESFSLGLTPLQHRLEPYVPTSEVYPQILAAIGYAFNPGAFWKTFPAWLLCVGGDIVAGAFCGRGMRINLSAGPGSISAPTARIAIGNKSGWCAVSSLCRPLL